MLQRTIARQAKAELSISSLIYPAIGGFAPHYGAELLDQEALAQVSATMQRRID
tara:strand:+ start:2724 stop:2885 length:162 start_codon:yes stop_codon:yes gene_type:complete